VRSRWGRGYATEGSRAALAYAFNVLREDRIISLILPTNHASMRVAERLGETLQGRAELAGKEHLVYGIERAAWLASRTSRAEPSAAGALHQVSGALH
jgi:RimJ/RimL family protein N-acetyltransferase